MLPYDSQILSGSFNRDGTRLATTSGDQAVQIWDVAVDVTGPLPSWVWRLAEALGDERLDEDGRLLPPEKSIFILRNELMDPASAHALKGDDFWSRLGRWFFMRRPRADEIAPIPRSLSANWSAASTLRGDLRFEFIGSLQS